MRASQRLLGLAAFAWRLGTRGGGDEAGNSAQERARPASQLTTSTLGSRFASRAAISSLPDSSRQTLTFCRHPAWLPTSLDASRSMHQRPGALRAPCGPSCQAQAAHLASCRSTVGAPLGGLFLGSVSSANLLCKRLRSDHPFISPLLQACVPWPSFGSVRITRYAGLWSFGSARGQPAMHLAALLSAAVISFPAHPADRHVQPERPGPCGNGGCRRRQRCGRRWHRHGGRCGCRCRKYTRSR